METPARSAEAFFKHGDPFIFEFFRFLIDLETLYFGPFSNVGDSP